MKSRIDPSLETVEHEDRIKISSGIFTGKIGSSKEVIFFPPNIMICGTDQTDMARECRIILFLVGENSLENVQEVSLGFNSVNSLSQVSENRFVAALKNSIRLFEVLVHGKSECTFVEKSVFDSGSSTVLKLVGIDERRLFAFFHGSFSTKSYAVFDFEKMTITKKMTCLGPCKIYNSYFGAVLSKKFVNCIYIPLTSPDRLFLVNFETDTVERKVFEHTESTMYDIITFIDSKGDEIIVGGYYTNLILIIHSETGKRIKSIECEDTVFKLFMFNDVLMAGVRYGTLQIIKVSRDQVEESSIIQTEKKFNESNIFGICGYPCSKERNRLTFFSVGLAGKIRGCNMTSTLLKSAVKVDPDEIERIEYVVMNYCSEFVIKIISNESVKVNKCLLFL